MVSWVSEKYVRLYFFPDSSSRMSSLRFEKRPFRIELHYFSHNSFPNVEIHHL